MDRRTVVVFAGTSEGYEICRFLLGCSVRVVCCVATPYGSSFPGCEGLSIHVGRLSREEMEEVFEREGACIGVDATHPYASEAHENIHQACHFAGIEYLRVSRSATERQEQVLYVKSPEMALDFLSHTQGNILLTTGSKDLPIYMSLPQARERIYARVLSLPQVILDCQKLGLEGRHLIAMQGPFCAELNAALLTQYDIRYLVSKDTGKEGGFPEKVEGAKRAGATLVVVGRPPEPEGLSLWEAKEFLVAALSLSPKREVTLLGIGMGGEGSLTQEGLHAAREAELLIGAGRILESLQSQGCKGDTFLAYRGDEILSYLKEHPAYQRVVVAFSGDVGFYSAAPKVLACLKEAGMNPRLICGVSSVQYFFARISLSWEDALLRSLHMGWDQLEEEMEALADQMLLYPKVFVLLGRESDVASLSRCLVERGALLTLYVGERLSYPDERILCGSPQEFVSYRGEALSVVVSVHEAAGEEEKKDRWPLPPALRHLPDSAFERGRVPMTKEEVRCLALSKLSPRPGDVCWDVGAGTGSVSIELGLSCPLGQVFSIEKQEEAVSLLKKNLHSMGLRNVFPIPGEAPGALLGLPSPDRVFVGGSGGNLEEIIRVAREAAHKAHKALRIVVTCITLETLERMIRLCRQEFMGRYDLIQVSIARGCPVGGYHMLRGENPVYLFTLWEEEA